ncbi:hypothetical protein psal_cds_27 [Pandoravirus salinus]|uniref:Uncharacterized protein n=1 Tax=Pandoravirus salinus TaxID=1349410 RepID=S4VZY6_9VIRU|nr:hypothetical protein psal_cds_27 [Pandoravirus salinus]AGO83395.1 hypothetical protein psal_cds_27 [Pandoravirus salinus]
MDDHADHEHVQAAVVDGGESADTKTPSLEDVADDRDSTVSPAVMGLLGPDLAARAATLATEDALQTKAETVASFLRWLATKNHTPTGPEAAQWVRDSGLVAWSDGLKDDVEIMTDVAEISTKASPSDPCDIPASAFAMAALLLVASHVVDAWPFAILMSPQDTINFKAPKGASTFIVDGAADGATLFEHAAAPAFHHVAEANVVDVYVRKFLDAAPMSACETALCGLLSTAAADIAAAYIAAA